MSVNWEELERIVDTQDFISDFYEDEKGQRCFIGELAARGGYAGEMVGVSESVSSRPALAQAASRWSGLTVKELEFLQFANDSEYTAKDRREVLLEALGTLRADRTKSGEEEVD